MADFDGSDLNQLRHRMLDAIGSIVSGTDWSPPEGGVVTEAVVVMVWMQPDGEQGMSFVPATNHFWSTEGLLRGALRSHLSRDDEADDDEDP